MDWTPGELSSDIEDRRSSSGGGGGFGGGGLGIIGFIVLLVISLVTGRNYIGSYLSGGGAASSQRAQNTDGRPYSASPAEDRSAHLVSWTLDDVQKTWEKLLPEQTGKQYRRAKLVLFRDYTQSACGAAQSQTGPFYCPADEKVYIDLSFWDELRHLGGSNADFAQAYVVAHELATTCRISSESNRRFNTSPARIRRRGTLSPSISNCRQTASQAYGRTAPSSVKSFTTPISPRACRQRQP